MTDHIDAHGSAQAMCDADHDEPTPAKAALVMLNTSSVDAVSYVCGVCLFTFWAGWLADPERCAYEVQVI